MLLRASTREIVKKFKPDRLKSGFGGGNHRYTVLRRTINRCSGTFRRQIPTGRTADSPGAAGSVSELKPSKSRRDERRHFCRRSLLVPAPALPAFLPVF